MSINKKHYYTLDEYFALEHVGDARYEYWDGDIICMSGGSKEHSRIVGRIHQRIANQLESQSRGCEAFISDQAVKSPACYPYRYPDVSVACGEAAFEQIRGIDVLTNPIVLIEVMSPTSAERDREAKFEIYHQIESLQQYLIVAQDRALAILHTRQDDGKWLTEFVSDLTATVNITAINCNLVLDDIYRGISFEN